MSKVLQHHILRAGPIGAIDIKENGIMFTLKYLPLDRFKISHTKEKS